MCFIFIFYFPSPSFILFLLVAFFFFHTFYLSIHQSIHQSIYLSIHLSYFSLSACFFSELLFPPLPSRHILRARQAKSKARQYQFYELVEKAKGRGPDQAKIQIATPEEKERQKRLGGVVAEFKGQIRFVEYLS